MLRLRRNAGQIALNAALAVLALVTFVPILTLVNLSFKDVYQFGANPMGITFPLVLENYAMAWKFMRDPLWHNLVVGVVSTAASLSMAALTAFVFARHQFPGRDLFFFAFLLILFVPGTVLLVPTFQLMVNFQLQNTLWALILPYSAHQSLMIFVLHSFFADLPADMFDAANVDGASTLAQFRHIGIPLALPALSAMAIFQVWWIWNDYAWPTLVANTEGARTAVTGVIYFNDGMYRPEPGAGMAAAVIAALPMVMLFIFTMRTFVAGLTAGAVKQ
jgi:ABC-type glycerol-3-phosphate transport system permease component